jgi:endothelin-converting enzyme
LNGASKSSDEENFDKMKAAYDACLDVDSIAKLGLQPLNDIVKKVEELFPVKKGDDLAIKNVALQKTISALAEIGVSTLIGAYTGADDRDPDSVIVSISPPYRVGLPAKERYEDEKIVKKYTEVLGEVLPKVHSEATIKSSEIKLLVEFEKKLAAASPSSEDRQDVTVRNTFR